MSTNQERRAEARQRLREQMEAQARREKQLKIAAASTVAILLLGLVGVVVWNKQQEARAAEHAANWMTCDYPATEPPQKVDPKQIAESGQGTEKDARDYNANVDKIEKSTRDVQAPTGEQPRRGTAEIALTLDRGEVPLTLDREKAPCNVASFVGLVEQKFFDDTPCHRLVDIKEEPGMSVLQCGDPSGTGQGGPGYSIVDEKPTDLAPAAGGPEAAASGAVTYPRGTVAMAKSQMPNSAGSQFFLVIGDSALPPEYSVVGTIGEPGLEVLDAIAKDGVKSKDQNNPDNQVPRKPISVEKAVLVSQDGLPEA